ncbi:unnamed protein product [Parnassius apollo]|uniref:(apollo) hypothetical protein n=1 Tax=Parnassius apollo TaxID=110799 RepID=A0A8S3W258_PARAO|nr:unnamed protein product [Parnassius apollo]
MPEQNFGYKFLKQEAGATINRDPSNQNQSLISKPPVENEVNDDDLSLNLENPEILNDMPYLDISVTEVIEHMSNEPIAGSSGIQKDVNDFLVETVRPLPKAPPRVPSNRKRARKSAILTDTPEKIALEEKHHIEELKKRKKTEKNRNKENKKNKKGSRQR